MLVVAEHRPQGATGPQIIVLVVQNVCSLLWFKLNHGRASEVLHKPDPTIEAQGIHIPKDSPWEGILSSLRQNVQPPTHTGKTHCQTPCRRHDRTPCVGVRLGSHVCPVRNAKRLWLSTESMNSERELPKYKTEIMIKRQKPL